MINKLTQTLKKKYDEWLPVFKSNEEQQQKQYLLKRRNTCSSQKLNEMAQGLDVLLKSVDSSKY